MNAELCQLLRFDTPLHLGELGIRVIYGMLGYLLFSVFEVVAKRRGTLEVF